MVFLHWNLYMIEGRCHMNVGEPSIIYEPLDRFNPRYVVSEIRWFTENDRLLNFLGICYVVTVFWQRTQCILNAWSFLYFPFVQSSCCCINDTRSISVIKLSFKASLHFACSYIHVSLKQVVLFQVFLEYLLWIEARVLSDVRRHHRKAINIFRCPH